MSIKMLYEKDGTTPMGSAMNVGYPQTSGGTALTTDTVFVTPSNGHIYIEGLIGNGNKIFITGSDISGPRYLNFKSDKDVGLWMKTSIPVRGGEKYIAHFPTGGGAWFYPDQET